MKAIDLYSGGGGTSLGAHMAGIDVLWAANHLKTAVETHKLNHPYAQAVCQDLQQADWSLVPDHDLMMASPCCQGHSKARGKAQQSTRADVSRATAWGVVSCLEIKKPPLGIVENVKEIKDWVLYDCWCDAIHRLGYSMSEVLVNCNTLEVPQSRLRLFIVITKSKSPLKLTLPEFEIVPASSFLDLSMEGHQWSEWRHRKPATVRRITQGQKDFGEVFIDTAYGSERTGHSIHKPIGTITTVNKHSLVMGDKVRALTIQELAAAQTFPDDYIWPKGKTITKSMIGNAVPPVAAYHILSALKSAA